MNKPEFVFFDLGNVLMFFDHSIACANLAALCDRSAEDIHRIVFESELQSQYEGGRITTQEFYEAFCEQLNVEVGLAEVCHAASAIFTPNYSIIPVVAQLQQSGSGLGILSNTCEAHWEYIFNRHYCFVNELFNVFALSFELRSSKPSPEIYGMASQLVGVRPSEIFFVDDRPENITAALDYGFDAVPFLDSLQLTRDLQARGLLSSL